MDTSTTIAEQLIAQGAILLDDIEFNNFKPATLCIYEWTNYWLTLPGVDNLKIGTRICSPLHDDWFQLRFENELGICKIQPITKGKNASKLMIVHVISQKFPGPHEHQIFYSGLLNDLFQRMARLPFTFQSSTAQSVVEAFRPPTPLFTYHFLKHYANEFQTSLNIIFANPNRLLIDEEIVLPLAIASNVGPDTLLDMMHRTSQWTKAEGHPLANRMNGFLPTHLLQHVPEETFDTPENRFVLNFLIMLQLAADDLKTQSWWKYVPGSDRQVINESKYLFQQSINHPLFDEVGEQHLMPLNSQVLLRKDGYRHILDLWQKYNLARRPLFEPLHQAIETRNVAELYEFWAFFALTEKIGDCLGVAPVFEFDTSDAIGLHWLARAYFSGHGEMIFNRTFRSSYPQFRTYSTTMRPDFSWVTNGKTNLIFDAKFSFSTRELPNETDELTQNYESIPSLIDLYKMHTYRDALNLKSAIIIYPGDSTVFYDVNQGKTSQLDLLNCLSGELNGIGAIPMCPGLNES